MNCTSCDHAPEPGTRYEETACATCSLCSDRYTASCGNVTWEDWMQAKPQYPAVETASNTHLVVSYILCDAEQRKSRYENHGPTRKAVNGYFAATNLDERSVISAMFRLGMVNRNVFSWLAAHRGATKQYWHKVWKRLQRRIHAGER